MAHPDLRPDLALRISPAVLAQRNRRIAERLGDDALDRVYSRRAAEVVATDLLKEHAR